MPAVPDWNVASQLLAAGSQQRTTIIPMSNAHRATRSRAGQSGAALLAFMLLVAVAASTMLLNRLDASVRFSVYRSENSVALREATDAIVAWAVSHPFNPGTLPMPDRNGDGNYDGDADCFNGTISANLLLGKLPWRGMPSPCKDAATLYGLSLLAVDGSGEQLWYAVSKNLVYESPDYPLISPGLLSKATDWITVRDTNGAVLSNRVAFIVIAPGPTLSPYTDCDGLAYAGQDRSGSAPAVGNYLDSVTIGGVTYSNADYDQDFIAYRNSLVTNEDTTQERCDRFNDQLVFVTIDELMEAVSKRALNEAASVLATYRNANGALPWLAPFADPKSDPMTLRGQATSASSNLVDSSADFPEWNVTPGDAVWNLTDGSMGIVTAVAANTLTIGAGLKFGTNNTFSVDDEYFVDVRYLPDSLMQAATLGSTGTTLKDSGRNFEQLGIAPGDVIENLTDGSRGIISEVDGDEIVAASLTGGAGNDFASGDIYRIRTNASRVTSNTANLTLIDSNVNFIAMGVQAGDIVHNLWDQAIGRVIAVDSSTQLRVDTLQLGTGVVFNVNEPYQISRYNGRNNTRIGLLPLHQQGEIIPTAFSVDWYSPNSGSTVTTTLATDATYTNALRNYAGASSGYSGTVTVNAANAKCTWIAHDIVRCKGTYKDTNAAFLAGAATTGSSSLAVRDSTKNFTTLGTKRGDKVRNLTDGTTGIVFDTSSTQLTLVNISGSSNVGIGVGENYVIDLATSSFTFNAAANSTANAWQYRVYYPGSVNESLLAVGDTIENTNGAQSVGRISSINTFSNYIVYTPLQGNPSGATNYPDIFDNELVRIRHDFVSERQYDFDVTFKGTSADSAAAGVRTRAVCRGYDASCTTAANNATLKGDGATAFVTIRDYEGTTEVGRATNILPTAGLASRSLRVSGLEFYLDDDYGDLPEWFVRNKWYQYVMVAYSNGDAPGGTTCVAGINCLTLNIRNASNGIAGTKDNVRALVMTSMEALPAQSWAAATSTDYFDDTSNTSLADNVFERRPKSSTFNDLIRIAASCPSDASKLCWSQ